jgi:class 3 adenylate cyclase/tetratricopeptide (TPR) repeat protein
LEDERKQVTVLFADLKDSTELIRGLDPEAAQRLLDPALQRMRGAGHRFEGTVNQVLGDGIMALFGAPIVHEDHALRACYAALAMQAAMWAYTEEVRRAHGLEMRIRVGLNSGEVVVRAIGNDLHMDYSAVGETTHLAARMEQLATPGSIRLTAATLRLVEGMVQVSTLGPVPVKGIAEPIEVFELLGASSTPRRVQAAAARGLTQFVGRQTEMSILADAMARADSGHGQVVALVGEAGLGKSRLVYELTYSHYIGGWLVLESASVSYGKATPYFPVIDLLKRYAHVEEHDDPRTIRAKVTGQVLTLDEALQDTLPALLSLLETLAEDSPFLQLDPSQRRQHTLTALKRVLLRESQVQPLLLVFEDLHWIDPETQALLDSLVESLPTTRLLLLVNDRPEYQHGWGAKTYYTQVRLDPLPVASAEELLQVLLGNDPSLAPLEFLYERQLFPEPEYTFKHALTHEVAYGSLLHERRRVLHARLVEALEALVPERVAEQVERLAHHAIRGELWDKAVTYCQQADDRAHDRAAYREAVTAFEQAIQALAHLPEHDDTRGLAIDLFLAVDPSLTGLGEHRRRLDLLREAEALARALDDRARLVQVLARMAQLLRTMVDYDGAIAAGWEALELAGALGVSALQVQVTHRLGQVYYAIGDFRRAAELLRQTVEAADRKSGTPSTVLRFQMESRAWLAQTLSMLGAFAESRRHGEEALHLAMLESRGVIPGIVHAQLGDSYLAQGELDHSIRVLEQGLALCRASGNLNLLRSTAASLGFAAALQGRLAEGNALLDEAIGASIRTGALDGQADRLARLSEVCRLAGRGEEAWQHARQALDLARQQKARGDEAFALHQLGTLHAHADPPEVTQAEAHYQHALALAEELGMRPLQAHCHFGLGSLYAKIGRCEQARTELSAAIDLYRAMEMTFWLPQAEAALADASRSMLTGKEDA